mgnify:CR=1 FL=1
MTLRAGILPRRPSRRGNDSRRLRACARCARYTAAALALFVVDCVVQPAGLAQDSRQPTIAELEAGFDGQFKVGSWAPFRVVIEGGSESATGHVEMTVADGDGVPSRVHAPVDQPVSVAPGQRVEVALIAKIGQLHGDVTVEFRGEHGVLATRRFRTGEPGPLAGIQPVATQLVVAVGGPLASYSDAYFERRHIALADVESVGELPRQWAAYEGVDALVIGTTDERIVEQLADASGQLEALTQWIRMGGNAIVCAGHNAQDVLVPDSPLSQLAPGTLETTIARLPSTALETYADASAPFQGPSGRFLQNVPKLADVRGRIVAYAGSGPRDLPLVVRTAHGFGEVVFAAFDLDQPPLSTWTARPQLLDRLLGHATKRAQDTEGDTTGEVTTLGFVDIAGQLRAALDQFAEVQLVPFWLVVALVVVYIAIIGPLDYYFVKRVLRRMEATWITFAVAVVLFGAAAYVLAHRLKGHEMHVNRVDLVDFDLASDLVRGTAWSNVFSPQTAAYDVSLDAAPAVPSAATPPQSLFSWMGLPGDGFGGMSSAAATTPLFTLAYNFSGRLDRLEHVPIAVWSSKPFVGRWWAESAAPLEAELVDDGRLAGTLSCNFEEPLEDCVLIYGRWAYPLRTLEPGQQIDLATQFDPQTVETFLRRVTVRGDRDVAPPYDQASFDIPRIVEIMSCYDLAGGENYTGLTNEYQEFVDLSQLVRNGRAILIGRRQATTTQLICNDEPLDDPTGQGWTFVRFVLPVDQVDAP